MTRTEYIIDDDFLDDETKMSAKSQGYLWELIRCRECKHRPHKNKDGYIMPPRVQVGVYAWGEPEYDDDETCPYVCEDRWYNSVPDDEQYCDRAEPKEKET
jgi:hypothetical protein